MNFFSNSISHLPISKADILNAMPHMTHDMSNLQELEETIHEVQDILAPRYIYVIYDDIQLREEHIRVGNVLLHCGSKIINLLHNSSQIAIAVCTLGDAITHNYQHYIQNTNYLKAYLSDIIANIAIAKTMKELKNKLRQDSISQELSITSNFGPGYCGWDIKEQKDVLSLLPTNVCPVTLTTSSLMQPIKSLSSIIGIGKDVKYKESNCSICNLSQCAYREQIKIQ